MTSNTSIPSAPAAAVSAGTRATPSAAPVGKPADVPEALQRLIHSRNELRMAMLPAPPSATAAPHTGSGVAHLAEQLTDKVRSLPGANVIVDAIRLWWAKHPLNLVGRVGAEAARRYTAPVAERNPVGLLLGAVAAGALLALLRPWRWLLRPALFAGLIPAIAFRALKEVPAASLLNVYSSVAGRGRSAPASRPVAPRTAAPASSRPSVDVPAAPSHPLTPTRQSVPLP